jgi:hypothetical protein
MQDQPELSGLVAQIPFPIENVLDGNIGSWPINKISNPSPPVF